MTKLTDFSSEVHFKEFMSNDIIEALKKKEAEIRARRAVLQSKIRRRMEKENARLFGIVGRVICGNVAQNPEGFGLMVKQVLDTG